MHRPRSFSNSSMGAWKWSWSPCWGQTERSPNRDPSLGGEGRRTFPGYCMKRIARILLDNIVWVIFLVLMVAFSVSIEGFFSPENYRNIIYHSVFIGMLAIAETLVLI